MHETTLKTDMTCFVIRRGDDASPMLFPIAAYYDGCPMAPWKEGDASHLAMWSAPLTTYVFQPVFVAPRETGVYYRLPDAVRYVTGGADCLIPLRIEIEHSPYADFNVDELGRAAVGEGDGDGRAYSTELRYGCHTVCGLFGLEAAKKWAALPRVAWSLLGNSAFERRYGLDPSWATTLIRPGRMSLSIASMPLLQHHVRVFRETV
jgi:hypothetical protein